MFTPINTAVPGGDTIGSAFGKTNQAMLDAAHCICMGVVPGWNNYVDVGAGTMEYPEAERWVNASNQSEIVRSVYVWASHGADTLIATTTYQRSSNGGQSYETLGVLGFFYDGNNNLLSCVWS